MSINSRMKGKNSELEFAGIVMEQTGIRLQRNLNQTRNGGYDLIVCEEAIGPAADALRSYAIECKRAQKAPHSAVVSWWKQACQQAKDAKKSPLLAYRADRQPWKVVIPLSRINSDMPHAPRELEYTVCLSAEGLGAVLRECG